MHAIVTALHEEVDSYLKQGKFKRAALSNGVGVYESSATPGAVVLEAGIGRKNAEHATRHALRHYRPDFIVSAGFAGAVSPKLGAGRLFLCDTLAAMDGPPALWTQNAPHPTQNVDAALMAKVARNGGSRVETCACMTVSVFIAGAGLKSWIGKNFPVQLIDMESYWVSRVAAEQGTPTAVVRTVLDTVEQDLPAFVSDEATAQGRRRWRRAIRHLAKRPGNIGSLLKLRRQAGKANEALSKFLAALDDGR